MEVIQIKNSQISENARACMKHTHRSELELLTCVCQGGVLRLQGEVSSFYLKQTAQEAVKNMVGISRVVNEVTVSSTVLQRISIDVT